MTIVQSVGLRQEQTQKLYITPELRQYMEILQFSSIDLLDFLTEQALENPVIEFEANMNFNKNKTRSQTEDKSLIELTPNKEETLHAFLMQQLGYQKIDERGKKIAKYIIGNINAWGYLEVDIAEIAAHLNASTDDVEQALSLVQSFEPKGIGARNLQECLKLQLQKLEASTHPLVETLIDSFLPEIAEGKLKQVALMLKVSPREVQDAIEDIRNGFNPKPGALYGNGQPTNYIIPDVIVEKVNQSFVVSLNEEAMPKVSIIKEYNKPQHLTVGKTDDIKREMQQYLQEKVQSALYIIRSLDRRKSTVYRVAKAIVERQIEFMEWGVEYIQPLILKDIAAELDMHESTISRTTQGKYMQTPHGVYELKYFFSSGLSNGTGEGISSLSVKSLISGMIQRENQAKPLSDAKLRELLEKEGIDISRRTVAKYREELGIPSSAKRKRY